MPGLLLPTRQALLNLLFRTAPAGWTRPAAFAVAEIGLLSVMPADDGTGAVEFDTGGGYGYARAALAASDANYQLASDYAQNIAEVRFNLFTGTTPEAVGIGFFDSAGTLRAALPFGGLPLNGAVTAADDTWTHTAHGFVDKQIVRALAIPGLSLPTGLAADTSYYVVGATADTLQLALTEGGDPIDLAADGACALRAWYGKAYAVNERAVIPAAALQQGLVAA